LAGTGQSSRLLEPLPAQSKGRCGAVRKQRGPAGSRRRISRVQVKGKGQLKLSVEVQGRILVLHVMEAKGLMGKEYRRCDSYVKGSIVPDADWKCRQKTKTVPDCKNPVFHEHFVFFCNGTLWGYGSQTELTGVSICPCIDSFFPPAQEISGWYYLLGEDLGRTKHLKVAARR
ncbi:Regulator of G-protein signaling 3, partial [Podiceps cristatus]